MQQSEELDGYTGRELNDDAYEVQGNYAIIDIATVRNGRIFGTVIKARLVSNQVVIELDHHDKSLADTLLA